MKVTFYGTRGSIPVSDPDCLEYGGNTACVLLTLNDGMPIIFDAGTGIRKLGKHLLKTWEDKFEFIPIVLSHTHWDHIQGFPFFGPAYDSRFHFLITICGKGKDCRDLETIFSNQMQKDYFPVPLDKMGAEFTFWQPEFSSHTGPYGNKWELLKHNHPGNAYSYRCSSNGKTCVYCTDIEHGNEIDERIIELSRDADLLIHDAQYTPEELVLKHGWGHSSWEQAIEVAQRANVKKLALFHHDPEHEDKFLLDLEAKCKKEFSGAFFAREGQVVEL